MSLQNSDLVKINRAGIDYQSTAADVMSLLDTDLLTVNRGGVDYKVTAADVMSLLDTDLLAVNRGGVDYKITGAEFKEYLGPAPQPDPPFNATTSAIASVAPGGGGNASGTPLKSWNALAYGNGTYVLMSYDSRNSAVVYSNDGITWNNATTPITEQWRSVAYGNGKFLASDTTGKLIESTDGNNWTTGTTLNNGLFLAYGNGKWVGVCPTESESVKYSTDDGSSWTTVSMTQKWNKLTFGNGKFLAGYTSSNHQDQEEKIMSSSDGINWTLVNTDYSDVSTSVAANGMFVTYMHKNLTNFDTVGTSSDAITWEYKQVLKESNPDAVDYGDNKFVGVSWNSGDYFAGHSSSIINSQNAWEWEDSNPTAAYGNFKRIVYGDNKFVAARNDSPIRVVYSYDGVNWQFSTVVNELADNQVYNSSGEAVGTIETYFESGDTVHSDSDENITGEVVSVNGNGLEIKPTQGSWEVGMAVVNDKVTEVG